MLFELFLAVITSTIVLYLPGYLVSKIFHTDVLSSLLIAPIISTVIYVALGIVLDILGVPCRPIVLLVLAIAIGIACLTVEVIRDKRQSASKTNSRLKFIPFKTSTALFILAFYIIIAGIITYIVLISVFDTSDALAKYDDNTSHFSRIRSFIITGTYSTIHSSASLDISDQGGFYPSAWHVQAAITASFFNDNVSIAWNSTLIVFLIFVIPTGIFFLLSQIFKKRETVAMGALFAISFGAFPWGFIIFGQLIPNLMSYSFIPFAMSISIFFIQNDAKRKYAVRVAILLFITLIAIIVAQTNGLFTFGIWLICYLVFAMVFSFKLNRFVFTLKRVSLAASLIIASLAIWTVLFYAPFLQDIVNFSWRANHSFFGALREALLFIYTGRSGMQVFFSITVSIGILLTLKNRKYLWLTISYLVTLLIYAIGDSSDGFIKHFVTGFWYTDPYRTAAMNALCAMPLAVLGFSWSVNTAANILCKIFKMITNNKEIPTIASAISISLLTLVMAIFQFTNFATFPIGERHLQTGMLTARNYLEWRYSSEKWLTSDEIKFTKEVMDTIPKNASVINIPNDGSEWLHGYLGLNTLYRRVIFGVSDDQTELIRGHLNEIASTPAVQEAVKNSGAHYVMVLDDKASNGNSIMDDYAYDAKKWKGIDDITVDTDGFELILSEGDMRLYKIDDRFFE